MNVWLADQDDWFKSARPGSRWCQSTLNEDFLLGLVLLSVPWVGTLGWAVTVNKVIQPWSDLESEIKARGGCSESSRRFPWRKMRSLLLLRPGRLVLAADTWSAFERHVSALAPFFAKMLDAVDLGCIINLLSQKKH